MNKKLSRISLILIFSLILNVFLHPSKLEGSNISIGYNKKGQITNLKGPGKRKTSISYNNRGQIKLIKGNKYTERYKYNRIGYLTNIKDSTGTTIFIPNDEGQLKEMIYPSKDRLLYKYYQNGKIASVFWKNKKFEVFYHRDLLGNIIKLKTTYGDFVIQYDYNQRKMKRIYPNGSTSYFEYHENGRPKLIRHTCPKKKLIAEYRYFYNDSGLLEKAVEKIQRRELTIEYTYDAYKQLLKAVYSDGRVYNYAYDMFGSMLKRSGVMNNKAVYDQYDRLVSFNGKKAFHDAACNLIQIGDKKFIFNDKDKLINDKLYHYKYNALGFRVSMKNKRNTRRFVHLIDTIPYILGETGRKTVRYFLADGLY